MYLPLSLHRCQTTIKATAASTATVAIHNHLYLLELPLEWSATYGLLTRSSKSNEGAIRYTGDRGIVLVWIGDWLVMMLVD